MHKLKHTYTKTRIYIILNLAEKSKIIFQQNKARREKKKI